MVKISVNLLMLMHFTIIIKVWFLSTVNHIFSKGVLNEKKCYNNNVQHFYDGFYTGNGTTTEL